MSAKLFRLQDKNVRVAESPSDSIICEVQGTLSGGVVSCTTPFKSAKGLGYLVMAKADTNSSGVLSADISKPGNSDDVRVLIFGKSQDLFNTI